MMKAKVFLYLSLRALFEFYESFFFFQIYCHDYNY